MINSYQVPRFCSDVKAREPNILARKLLGESSWTTCKLCQHNCSLPENSVPPRGMLVEEVLRLGACLNHLERVRDSGGEDLAGDAFGWES